MLSCSSASSRKLWTILCSFTPLTIIFLPFTHAHKHMTACAVDSSGKGEVVTTCSGIITGADGNKHLCAVSSILPLIGQKLYVSLWPVQTTRAFWCQRSDLTFICGHRWLNASERLLVMNKDRNDVVFSPELWASGNQDRCVTPDVRLKVKWNLSIAENNQ